MGRTVQDGHLDSHTAPELCAKPTYGFIPFVLVSSPRSCRSLAVCPGSRSHCSVTKQPLFRLGSQAIILFTSSPKRRKKKRKKTLKQDCKIQTHERFKRTLFVRTKIRFCVLLNLLWVCIFPKKAQTSRHNYCQLHGAGVMAIF